MTVTVVFLRDPNGEQQVPKLLADIKRNAEKNEDYAELLSRINDVFRIISSIGVPEINNRTHFSKGHKGQPITLSAIVKELKYHPPLLESRANGYAVGIGAFRAIFFYEKDRDGNQTIYYTQAILKQNRSSTAFNNAISISEKMMIDFYKAKGGYVIWDKT